MGYGFSFGEPAVHLESMCGSSSSDPSRFLDGITSCTLFGACSGPSSEQSKKISGGGGTGGICDVTESDAACFPEEKDGPIKEIASENAVTGTDATGLVKDKIVFGSQEASSCTEINSTMLSANKNDPVELPSVVSPDVKEDLSPPLVNGSDIPIDYSEDFNAKKGIEVTRISKDDVGLADAFGSHLSTFECTDLGRETSGINMDDSANVGNGVDTALVDKDKVRQIGPAGLDPPGLVSPCVKGTNKEEFSQMQGENASMGELHCNEEKVPLAKMPKEREGKPKPSELIVFTRRNPKRSATHAESDLNIDRLTRISNRGRKTRKDKEIFDPTLLVSLIRNPTLTTKKRKPSNRRVNNSVWWEIKHLSLILDLSFEHFKLKQEKEAKERKQIALGEKMDGKSVISNQFVTDLRHLKQEVILDRDLDSSLTYERSSMGNVSVQRATNQGETADPGSSPDSVVYNPVSCEANPVLLRCKQSTKSRKKKNKGEKAKPSKRGTLLNVCSSTNQGKPYWFQIDKKGKSISNWKKEEKAQELHAPRVAREETGNTSDPYSGVTIASHSGSIESNGTQKPRRYGQLLSQLLSEGPLSTPVPPGSISVATQSILVPSDSMPMPGQTVMVPELPRQPLPVHMQPMPSLWKPVHVPLNPADASVKPMQVKAHLPVQAPLQLEHEPVPPVPITAKSAPKPRVAWVCCDECGKWRCIPAGLADVIDETNCRWTCKDNANKAFADCSIPQEKSNAEINAELELSDASGDEGPSGHENGLGDVDYMKPLAGDTRLHSTKSAKKALGPAPYTPLKTNLFLHRNRRTQTIDEIMVCNCKPPENGGVGCRSQCLNRILSIECIRGMCPCGDLCSNQQFQRRNYAKLMYFRSGKKGYGLQLLEDVPAGRFLIEYVGEVLDMVSYEARQKEYASRGQKHFYFMTLNGGEVIDACAKGNLGRFINHSCDPNCRTEKWIVNGEVCIGLFAIRDIKKGEELTFDYNYVRVVGAAAKKCFCGAAACRGYLGGDPSSTDLVVQEDSDEEDYFEPVTAKQQERKIPIQKAAIATLSDNSLKKHPPLDKSQNKHGLSMPFAQKDSSLEVHNLGYIEHVTGSKPDSAVSQLASSLVTGPMGNSQQDFGLLPQENFSQTVIHPEISLDVSNSKNRENSRHKTDSVLSKPSDSQGASGLVNGGALSRAIISAGNFLEISKSENRDDISQCKPDSMLSLPANSHEVGKLLDKEDDKMGEVKDITCPPSSSIAVSSYSLLKLHLSRVNSLGEFKMGDKDGSSRPSSPGTSFSNNSVSEYKPVEKESFLEGLSEKSVPSNKSLEKCSPVDREKLYQPRWEDAIRNNFPYDICAANKEADDASTPELPDHYNEEQEPVDMDMDNLCESQCIPVSPSDGYAQLLPMPDYHNLPNEDIPSEEDAARTPVHVTRYLSDKVHSRRSGGMEADKTNSRASKYDKPSDSFDAQPEQVGMCLNKVDQPDRPLSPSAGFNDTKTASTDATDEGVVICQEVKEVVHNITTLDFEGVEEKLTELLDQDGSISRRKPAIKGYLKLLIVTAAAGDTGTSQRLKDLSLILDALLKTKSYTVLTDIMKTNGLQMLHTILKQNRDDFNRIPIVRKLLKVLGHLGDMDILTVEQMNQGPPRPGMESFRESIYKLTKHENNKVNRIAREFFNRWMPKSMRVHNSFAHTCNPSTSSKRRSCRDHFSDFHTQEPDLASCKLQAQEVERPSKRPCLESLEEDAPPGFEPVGPPPGFEPASPPGFESVSPHGLESVMQTALSSVSDAGPVQVALGYQQEKYRPGISVSYGIPAVTAQNLGVFVHSEGRVFWGIAPGIPFQPFPPLPPHPIVGDVSVRNNGPGFCNDRSRRRWGSNLRNQRRFSRPCNNEYACDNRRRFSKSGKDRPKWSRDRR